VTNITVEEREGSNMACGVHPVMESATMKDFELKGMRAREFTFQFIQDHTG